MKLISVMATALLFIITASPAEAAKKHKRHHHKPQQIYIDPIFNSGTRIVSHPDGCPRRAFCGCGVSVKVFGRPVRNLYLAANWLKFPRATPGPGMVAARRGHVMYIEAYDGNGNATVYDPNSGNHKTRIHTRSLAGYRIVNPHGSMVANL